MKAFLTLFICLYTSFLEKTLGLLPTKDSSPLSRSKIAWKLLATNPEEETDIQPRKTNNDEIAISPKETQDLIEAQQKQIDMLVDLVSSSLKPRQNENLERAGSESPDAFQPTLRPLKAMLFIDGTWLYYSLHEREDEWCPLLQRFGRGWQYKYNIDWGSLPRIVCQALQEQDKGRGWNAVLPRSDDSEEEISRPIDVVRVSVFTSYKADTPKTSFRYKMFQDMLNARYDVQMMETVGKGEKCVDIQLAVDMLHYATVPNAYDIAILLSGDKDYLPAMVRCRQKGRRVGLVSMRRACNRALIESPNVKDYDVIWLEDHLDELVKPKSLAETRIGNASLSSFTLMRIIHDFILESSMPRVSSRDVGKYIKSLMIGNRCVLDEVKETYGGLYQFLIVSGIFVVEKVDKVKAFWVALSNNANLRLSEAASKTQFTRAEKNFFEEYSLHCLADKEAYYFHSLHDLDEGELVDISKLQLPKNDNTIIFPEESVPDYNTYTVAKLKEICRERDLPVSGKKVDLIERIEDSLEDERERSESVTAEVANPEGYLQGLLLEYLQVKGGKASSRDVGRYLQANKASPERLEKNAGQPVSALSELKELYGSMRKFIMQSGIFFDEEIKDAKDFEFQICVGARREVVR